MRKILSIVIAVLMVSMMIPSMALADAAISVEVPAIPLVAGESFTLTPAVTDGSSTVKLEVNAKVFTIAGGTTNGDINALEADAGTTFTVTVNSAIPAEAFSSNIRISTASNSEKFAIDVADRLVGDVDGEDGVNLYDALQIAAFYNGKAVCETFNSKSADASQSEGVNLYDALQIAAFYNGKEVSNTYIGTQYLGGDADIDVTTDPLDSVVTPDDPEEPTVLSDVTGLYAYYKQGTVYYIFEPAEDADSYDIYVNDVKAGNSTTTEGSVADAAWNGSGENTIKVIPVAANATSPEGAAKNIVIADSEGALSQWLTANNLEGVTITVHEVK